MQFRYSAISSILFTTTCAAVAAPLDLFLDFNDNQIPPGWTLQDTSASGHHVGIAAGNFYAAQVDSSANLYTSYAPAGSNPVLDIQWDGSVFQTYYGNSLFVSLIDSHGNQFSVGIWAKQVFNGNGVRFYVQENSNNYFQQLNVPNGTYNFSASFSNSNITFASSLNGAPVYSTTRDIPSLNMRDINRIQFSTSETTGPDSWFDNIKILETVTNVPESSTTQLLVAGGVALAALRSRRRSKLGV